MARSVNVFRRNLTGIRWPSCAIVGLPLWVPRAQRRPRETMTASMRAMANFSRKSTRSPSMVSISRSNVRYTMLFNFSALRILHKDTGGFRWEPMDPKRSGATEMSAPLSITTSSSSGPVLARTALTIKAEGSTATPGAQHQSHCPWRPWRTPGHPKHKH